MRGKKPQTFTGIYKNAMLYIKEIKIVKNLLNNIIKYIVWNRKQPKYLIS